MGGLSFLGKGFSRAVQPQLDGLASATRKAVGSMGSGIRPGRDYGIADPSIVIIEGVPYRSSGSKELNRLLAEYTSQKQAAEAIYGEGSKPAKSADIAAKGLIKLQPSPWETASTKGAAKMERRDPVSTIVTADSTMTGDPASSFLFDLSSFQKGAGEDLLRKSVMDSDALVGDAKEILMTPLNNSALRDAFYGKKFGAKPVDDWQNNPRILSILDRLGEKENADTLGVWRIGRACGGLAHLAEGTTKGFREASIQQRKLDDALAAIMREQQRIKDSPELTEPSPSTPPTLLNDALTASTLVGSLAVPGVAAALARTLPGAGVFEAATGSDDARAGGIANAGPKAIAALLSYIRNPAPFKPQVKAARAAIEYAVSKGDLTAAQAADMSNTRAALNNLLFEKLGLKTPLYRGLTLPPQGMPKTGFVVGGKGGPGSFSTDELQAKLFTMPKTGENRVLLKAHPTDETRGISLPERFGSADHEAEVILHPESSLIVMKKHPIAPDDEFGGLYPFEGDLVHGLPADITAWKDGGSVKPSWDNAFHTSSWDNAFETEVA